jgi:hypothetical protein
MALLLDQSSDPPQALQQRVLAVTRDQSFNYVEWEVAALWSKARQELWGFHAFIPEAQRSVYLLAYFDLQRQIWALEDQLAQSVNPTSLAQWQALEAERQTRQALAEHLIEGQVSSVLRDEGLAWAGQVLPPVTMRFWDIPDLLVVSPRREIRQALTQTLQPMAFEERVALESRVAQALPDYAVWVTPIGGVGIWPAMITETDQAIIAFEITAHEWTHHYLIFFPLGLGYFENPETRIINETTATLVGDEVGNKVIERFYAAELSAGQVKLQALPDYRALLAALEGTPATANEWQGRFPTPFEGLYSQQRSQNRALADYLLALEHPQAAQLILEVRGNQAQRLGFSPPSDPNLSRPSSDQRGWISQTRLETDYLLSLGLIEAAEASMERGRQLAGLRVLNQAWFAFNAGYQANPVVQTLPDGKPVLATSGGGGDPIGAAIYEVRARADSLKHFLELMRGITTAQELLALVEQLRGG